MLALIYSLFGASCGWLEAILYDLRGAEAFKFNEHVGMMCQRVLVVIAIIASAVLYHFIGNFWMLLELVPAALLFPAAHDEAYNFTRLWLNYSNKNGPNGIISDREAFASGWRAYRYGYQSPTTTARNDFNGKQRTWLLAAGLLLLAVLQYFFWLR